MSIGSRPIYRAVTGIAPPYVMYNNTSGTFYGYCIDLLNDIGSLAGFDYTIRKSFDEKYGDLDPKTGLWNGMIYELTSNMSDIAVGPIWITSSRAQVFIDPYCVVKRISNFFSCPERRTKRPERSIDT